jgi:hypothetical protein
VAQGVGPEIKPQYCAQKKKKKKIAMKWNREPNASNHTECFAFKPWKTSKTLKNKNTTSEKSLKHKLPTTYSSKPGSDCL